MPEENALQYPKGSERKSREGRDPTGQRGTRA